MIFPKDQKIIRKSMNQQLKREALELIISLYLQRIKDEELMFLKDNFGTTQNLAMGIRSNLSHGLSPDNINMNRLDYGQNAKKEPEKCLKFLSILKNQLLTVYFLAILLVWIIISILESYNQNSEYINQSQIIFIFNLILVVLRIFIVYSSSRRFAIHSFSKDKNNLYQVIRNGKPVQIKQHELIVGDIVQLGFKEKVPASGLLISNKQIYLKQRKTEQKIESKLSLQNCLRKIKSMSALQLKLCYEEQNLPSPVLIRGSQLIHGSTFKMMVLSVTQEDLFGQYQPHHQDKFSFKLYSDWVKKLKIRWQIKSYIFIFAISIVCILGDIISKNIITSQIHLTFQFFQQIIVKIAISCLILNPANLTAFLRVYELLLYTSADMPQNIVSHLAVQQIICDEKNIVMDDNVSIVKYALCERMDLADTLDIGLHPLTVNSILEIQSIFNLGPQSNSNSSDGQKVSKFVLINKKKTKIISCPNEEKENYFAMKKIYEEIANVSNKQNLQQVYPQRSMSLLKLRKNENEKKKSQQFLNFPKQNSQIQNINQIINSRCRIKSRAILAGIVELAQKGCKTYYYQIYDNIKMDQITHVISNGSLYPISQEDRDRMKMLARKITMIYDLTPIMLGMHQGPYQNKPLKILACLIGVHISPNNRILQAFHQFQKIGIKSIITISKSWLDDEQSIKQDDIYDEYKQRKWIDTQHNSIIKIDSLRQKCGRLICSSCLISNCDCKDKIEQVSHIQPFIEYLSSMKIVYNLDEEGISFLQKALNQLKNNHLCINSQHISANQCIQSIRNCILFVEGIRRSLCLVYLLPLIYFLNPIIFWIRNLDILKPQQIVISFGFCSFWLFFCIIFKISTSIQNTHQYNRHQITLVSKRQSLFVYSIFLLSIGFTQILFHFSYLIPESRDGYDELIEHYELPLSCKYSIGQKSVSNSFKFSQCTVTELNIFSKISSMIVIYLYFIFWLSVVIHHRNFKSFIANTIYILSFLAGLLAVFFPQNFNLYPFGMNYIQIIIIGAVVILTALISKLIIEILMIYQDGLQAYFSDELESSIKFSEIDKNYHYSNILKRYERQRKLMGSL